MTIYHLLLNRLTLFIIHFSVCSVSSVAQNVSIKNNKLCKTNPISEKPKMNLTLYITKDYENNRPCDGNAKTNPNKPNLVSLSNLFQYDLLLRLSSLPQVIRPFVAKARKNI